jgi:hypothetical protein
MIDLESHIAEHKKMSLALRGEIKMIFNQARDICRRYKGECSDSNPYECPLFGDNACEIIHEINRSFPNDKIMYSEIRTPRLWRE